MVDMIEKQQQIVIKLQRLLGIKQRLISQGGKGFVIEIRVVDKTNGKEETFLVDETFSLAMLSTLRGEVDKNISSLKEQLIGEPEDKAQEAKDARMVLL